MSLAPPQSEPPTKWDLVIEPRSSWLDLHLSDLWKYRDLIAIFVWRDFVAHYKQTILGPLWYFVQPVFTTLLFTFVFSNMVKVSTDKLPPLLFYLTGITCWNYFAECLNRTSGTFLSNASVFGKVYFPRLTVPLSMVISSLIKFGIQFALFIVVTVGYMIKGEDIHLTLAVLMVPVLILLMAALGLGTGIIVSALTTKYRNLHHLVSFGVQLAMFATPVIYPISILPSSSRWILIINPMASIIEAFRYAFLGVGYFNFAYLTCSAAIILVILAIGILLFNHVEKSFMDTV